MMASIQVESLTPTAFLSMTEVGVEQIDKKNIESVHGSVLLGVLFSNTSLVKLPFYSLFLRYLNHQVTKWLAAKFVRGTCQKLPLAPLSCIFGGSLESDLIRYTKKQVYYMTVKRIRIVIVAIAMVMIIVMMQIRTIHI